MEKYKIEYNDKTNKFEIRDMLGVIIATCTNQKAAKDVKALLQKDKDSEPVNDNSILNTPIAKATREILGKGK